MIVLTVRQRQALIALAIANIIAIIGVGVLLLRGQSRSDAVSLTSPVDDQQSQACRTAVSQALFESSQSSLVHIDGNGTILIEIHRELTTDTLRLDADAAMWAALEAVAHGNECRRLINIHVNVLFSTPNDIRCREPLSEPVTGAGACAMLRAVARVGIVDVMTWAVGAIDDEELAKRIVYVLPEAEWSVPEDTTTLP